MAAASRARVRNARAALSDAALERRALAAPAAPPLELSSFDVIAELKLRSPAAGGLAAATFDRAAQLRAYADAGAAAISVLTEPTEFHGDLEHLAEAARLLEERRCPVMRKDFITDRYQVLEARAAGAGGVLVIVTMLDDATVRDLIECARTLGMFTLLEAFDVADLARLEPYDAPPRPGDPPLLAGVNCRDLRDLNVRFERFAELAARLPRHLPVVAESGIGGAADARAVALAGYRLALVGSSLMRADDPGAALAKLVAAGRAARAEL
jgi:indole-3-glycerol phosphate synthase